MAPFGSGGFEQVCYHLLHIVVVLQIGKGVIAVAFVHIQKIDHFDLITLPFQQATAIAEQLSFAIQDEKRGVRLAEIDLCIKAAFPAPLPPQTRVLSVLRCFRPSSPMRTCWVKMRF